jgi:hypothetical protein
MALGLVGIGIERVVPKRMRGFGIVDTECASADADPLVLPFEPVPAGSFFPWLGAFPWIFPPFPCPRDPIRGKNHERNHSNCENRNQSP